jgi:hypothetical protein
MAKTLENSVTPFEYCGLDKSQWANLWGQFRSKLIDKDISYILDTPEVQQRLTAPEIPTPLMIPPDETANARITREFNQQIAMEEYKDLAKMYRKYGKEVPKDYKLAEKLLLDLLSRSVKEDMQQYIDSPTYMTIATQQLRYEALWGYLHKKYGPYSAADVAKLKQKLTTLDGDRDGWRVAYHDFNQTVATLAAIPKRDAAGNTIYIAGVQQNWRPDDEDLKINIQEALERSTNTMFKALWGQSIAVVNNHWTLRTICQEIERLLQYEYRTDPHHDKKSKLAYSAVNGTTGGGTENPTKKARYAGQKGKAESDSKCKNCGKSHKGQRCTSTKCGVCGKNFPNTLDRFNHWMMEHKGKEPTQQKAKEADKSSNPKKWWKNKETKTDVK